MTQVKSEILQALVLTKDEEANIGRVLDRLKWLEKIVVLDSYSTDKTSEIVKTYPNVEIHERVFDTHATQWNHALSLAKSEWVLSLDADYILDDDFVTEIREKIGENGKSAYFTNFKFLVFGRNLIGDNTTPRPVLFKRSDCQYFDDGHTQRLEINGETGRFSGSILHDDRKPLSRWLSNQDSYSIKECEKLLNSDPADLSFISKIRKTKIFAPIFVFLYCLFIKRLIFSGWHGWHYTLQRTMVEMLLALRLVEKTKLND